MHKVQGPSISPRRRKHQTRDFGQISIWNFLYLSLPRRSSTSSSPSRVADLAIYLSLLYLCDIPLAIQGSRDTHSLATSELSFPGHGNKFRNEGHQYTTPHSNLSSCARVRRKHAVQAVPTMDCPSSQSNQSQSQVHPNP